MSFTSAFLAGFASTALEQQKRAMEQRQFDATLAIQQAALQTQQQKFDQEMALREAERQDRLQQNQVENQISTFRANTEAAQTASLIDTRKEGLAEKEQASREKIKLERDKIRNDPKILAMKQQVAELKDLGFDTSQVESDLAQRYKELGGQPPENDQDLEAPGTQKPAGPLTGHSQNQAQAVERNPGEEPQAQGQAAPGSTQTQIGGPGQATPSGAPPEAPAPSASAGAAPAAQPSAASPYSRTAQPPQPPLPAGAQKGFEEMHADSPEQAAEMNKLMRAGHIPKVWISDEEKAKHKREKAENDLKTIQAQNSMAEYQKGTVEDLFRQRGYQVAIDVHQAGTEYSSRRGGFHFGSTILGSGLTAGGTSGQSEKTLAHVDMYPTVKPHPDDPTGPINQWLSGHRMGFGQDEDQSLDTTVGMAQTLADGAKNGVAIPQPYVRDMQDMFRGQIASQMGKYGEAKSVNAEPFDMVLNPERHKAASAAIVLGRADQQMAAISKQNDMEYNPTGVPQVVDANNTPSQTLGLFGQTVDKLSVRYPNESPNRAEGQVLSELSTRMQGQTLDEKGKAEAASLLKKIEGSTGVSDKFKKQAGAIIAPLLSSGNEKPAGKKTSMGGAMSMPNAALLSSLGGLSQFGAEKANGGTAPENVTAANKAFGSVTQKTKDKAETAVADVKGQFGRMADDEKQKVQSTWKARRAVWKNYGIKESILKDMNEAVGLDRNDGF